MRGVALASLAIAGGLPALAEERPGRVLIDETEHDVIDIFVDGGKLHYRKAGKGPQEAALSEVDSFLAYYKMRLRTTAGDVIMVSRVGYSEGKFRLAAPRLGEFVYPRDEVESIAFEGARSLYADLARLYVFKAGVHIEDTPLFGELSFSYIQSKSTGSDQTLLARLSMERVFRNWRQTLGAKQLLVLEDGSRDTDVRELGYKAERFVTADWSLWGDGALASDSDADIDFRASVGVGVGRQLFTSDAHELLAEIGYAFLHERSGSVQNEDNLLRLGVSYDFHVKKRPAFVERVVLFTSGTRTRFRSQTSIVYRSSSRTFFRLSFVVDDDDEPLPGTPATTTSTEVAFGWMF